MKINVICANDSMELAFPPDTDAKIINVELARIKKLMDGRYDHNSVYVHLDEVEFFAG
jgi:hypothetical protein